MQSYEILPHTADIRVKATGSTRPGMLVGALKGMFAAAGPREIGESQPVERPFAVESVDFPSLLVDLLNEALFDAETNSESYEEIRFDLVTDKTAKGAFIGRPVAGFETQIKAATHGGLEIGKNEQGEWEAIVTFDA